MNEITFVFERQIQNVVHVRMIIGHPNCLSLQRTLLSNLPSPNWGGGGGVPPPGGIQLNKKHAYRAPILTNL